MNDEKTLAIYRWRDEDGGWTEWPERFSPADLAEFASGDHDPDLEEFFQAMFNRLSCADALGVGPAGRYPVHDGVRFVGDSP